jgi:Immunoglobulin I-set domain/Immunoglobulin domain
MKIFPFAARRWPSLNLPAACLLALLQRAPALRVAIVAEEFLLQSPAGAVLKSVAATLGALGAVHSLAGATQFVVTPSPNVSGTVGRPLDVAFTIVGSPTPPFFFRVSALPPGLATVPAADASGMVQAEAPVITGSPTQAGQFTVNITGSDGLFTLDGTIVFNISGAASTDVAPTFTTQPSSQTVNAGATVVFTATAGGSPPPTFQWQKNGAAISGATAATLSLPTVQTTDAGSYICVATNSAGSATSNAATLTVNTVAANSSAPVFTIQPASKTVATGSTAVFSATASGTPAPTYQWNKNGTSIAGATSSTLSVPAATAASAGSFTCVATNSAGAATSTAATLGVSATADFGRIINLSILTGLSSSEGLFTVGVSIGGAGTSGTKPLVIRAGGPALATLGVGGVLPDPKLDVFSGSAVMTSNDNWGGTAALTAAFTAVGAFPFNPTSKDAAVNPTMAAGGYTVQVRDAGGASGTVIAELYDATPAASFTATTPRLINVSVLKQIDAGSLLTVGFVIGGSTAKTLLVRVVGPTLTAFGVGGAMPDPKLDLFSGSTVIASNDNWGGDPQLTAAGNAVGAFAFASATSKDAMLLVTLAPGGYTVQASGVAGSSGSALVEVYEVP